MPFVSQDLMTIAPDQTDARVLMEKRRLSESDAWFG
jgi:hypothetical protein